jgi:hypothetical protein
MQTQLVQNQTALAPQLSGVRMAAPKAMTPFSDSVHDHVDFKFGRENTATATKTEKAGLSKAALWGGLGLTAVGAALSFTGIGAVIGLPMAAAGLIMALIGQFTGNKQVPVAAADTTAADTPAPATTEPKAEPAKAKQVDDLIEAFKKFADDADEAKFDEVNELLAGSSKINEFLDDAHAVTDKQVVDWFKTGDAKTKLDDLKTQLTQIKESAEAFKGDAERGPERTAANKTVRSITKLLRSLDNVSSRTHLPEAIAQWMAQQFDNQLSERTDTSSLDDVLKEAEGLTFFQIQQKSAQGNNFFGTLAEKLQESFRKFKNSSSATPTSDELIAGVLSVGGFNFTPADDRIESQLLKLDRNGTANTTVKDLLAAASIPESIFNFYIDNTKDVVKDLHEDYPSIADDASANTILNTSLPKNSARDIVSGFLEAIDDLKDKKASDILKKD